MLDEAHSMAPDHTANGALVPLVPSIAPGPETTGLKLVVVIPCLDEELGIAAVVRDVRAALPDARILVVDNGSTDRTAERAREAGAEVLVESRRGKAQAIVPAFGHVVADALIMIDGDGSYPADGAKRLLEAFRKDPADMITGVRMAGGASSFRPMHQAGTRAFETVLRIVFGYRCNDLFSGLRLFSRRFYENVPILSRGFELELEFTIQSIDKGFRSREIPVPFTDRAAGSVSKLRSIRDGLRLLRLLVVLFRDYRPVRFFGAVSALFGTLGLLAGSLPIYEYWQTRLVGRFPLAFLAASLMVISFFSLQTGLIIEGTLRYQREATQLRLRRATRAITSRDDA